uniref:Bromo domain-containing protein n=1 Tax=Ditylenchus dipsaci TaxID=166011 RepID=A0A915DFD0_9BILA
MIHNGMPITQPNGPMTPTRPHITARISNLNSASPVVHVSVPGEQHMDSPILTAHLLNQNPSSNTPPSANLSNKQAKVKIFESSHPEEDDEEDSLNHQTAPKEQTQSDSHAQKSSEPVPTIPAIPANPTTPDSTVIIPTASLVLETAQTANPRLQKRPSSDDLASEDQPLPKRANIIVEGEEENGQTSGDAHAQDNMFGVKLEIRSPAESLEVVLEAGCQENGIGKENHNSPMSEMQQVNMTAAEPLEQQSTAQQSSVDQWEDYCYVCNQGCDEYTGELGCCFGCPKVFHNCCHVPAIKQQMVDLPDDWRCKRLLCSKVLLACFREHQQAEPFLHEVSRSNLNYHAIIKEPITLKDVAQMISLRRYEQIEEFMEDMNKIFRNCSTYNGSPSDPIARAGRAVYSHYLNAVRQYLPAYINNVWVYIALYDTRNSEEAERSSKSPSATSSRIRTLKRSKREHSMTKGAI